MRYYIDAFRKYARFSGRARRREYWMFELFNMLAMALAIVVDNALGLCFGGFFYGPVYLAYALASLLPNLGIGVRRLHDAGRSGGFIFVALIPVAGQVWLIALMCAEGVGGSNEYGEDPKASERAIEASAPFPAEAPESFESVILKPVAPRHALELPRIPAFFADPVRRFDHAAAMMIIELSAFALLIAAAYVMNGSGGGYGFLSTFLSTRNIANAMQGFLPIAILAIGAAIVFSRGGFDLSVGAIMGLSGMVMASMSSAGSPAAIPLALLAALAAGLLNAAVVGFTKAPGFLVTVASAFIIRSASFGICEGRSIAFDAGPGLAAAIAVGAWIVLALGAAGAMLWLQFPGIGLKASPSGEAGAAAGFRRACSLGAPYLLSGLLAGIAGIFLATRLRAGVPSLGSSYEVQALFAVVLSGSLIGARYGNVIGVLIGALFAAFLANLLALCNASYYVTLLLIGTCTLLWFAIGYVVAAVMDASYRRR
jgi:ribose/xylose/arabinose/galactoside ABC-type transport system permease subunit/uncharacterized membrane protein YhaH (DUF805 family)